MKKKMINMVLLFVVLLLVYYGQASTIPSKIDGFWYEERRAVDVDSVQIEAFLDPVCPDSRDTWPHLKRALTHYGSKVSLLVHPFPLPYHDNAFVCSRALHVVNQLKPSATFGLLESFFQHQESFYGKATINQARAAVVDEVAKFAAKSVGESLYARIKSGFNDTKTDQATRISFKYGCVKGVFGTPIFFVNGFVLPDAGSPLNFNTWKSIIDPLLK